MLEGKRIAILAEDNFEDSELTEPLRAMKEAGARVLVVGSGSKKGYTGKRGSAQITVDTTADKVDVSQLDAIIISGGYAPDKMCLHKPMVDLVREAHGKVLLITEDNRETYYHSGLRSGIMRKRRLYADR